MAAACRLLGARSETWHDVGGQRPGVAPRGFSMRHHLRHSSTAVRLFCCAGGVGRKLFVVLVCVALGVMMGPAASVQAVVPPKPVVTGITPTGGSTAGGTVVTVTGTNLTGATRATLGGNRRDRAHRAI